MIFIPQSQFGASYSFYGIAGKKIFFKIKTKESILKISSYAIDPEIECDDYNYKITLHGNLITSALCLAELVSINLTSLNDDKIIFAAFKFAPDAKIISLSSRLKETKKVKKLICEYNKIMKGFSLLC